MKPKQRIWSYAFTNQCLSLCTQLSYRKSTDVINSMMHRSVESDMKMRTLADFAESVGADINAHLKAKTDKILEEFRYVLPTEEFTSESEDVVPDVDISGTSIVLEEDDGLELKKSIIAEKIEAINADREPAEQIKVNPHLFDMEIFADECVYISIDDVGAKQQKTTRKDGGTKNGRFVENTVIHIQAFGKSYLITALGLDCAFRMLMAFLLSNGLLTNHRLIFFADGAKSIKGYIEKYFFAQKHTLILDWYHLKKKCKELISSSLKGSIDEKKLFAKALLRILWAGNADEAIAFLNDLPKSKIKSEHWLTELTGYIDRKKQQIICYALRHSLKLRVSSNRVEKANDMLVAERQKHSGMSWSPSGSSALASISMLFHNGEADQWLRCNSLCFSLRPENAALVKAA